MPNAAGMGGGRVRGDRGQRSYHQARLGNAARGSKNKFETFPNMSKGFLTPKRKGSFTERAERRWVRGRSSSGTRTRCRCRPGRRCRSRSRSAG